MRGLCGLREMSCYMLKSKTNKGFPSPPTCSARLPPLRCFFFEFLAAATQIQYHFKDR
jgi:hypothetical protein